MKDITRKKARFFYGYWIVAAAFICLFVVSGCSFYALSLFVRPLQDEFNWSRTEVMLGNTIMMLTGGAASVLVGRINDRYGPKRVIIAGAFIGGLSLMTLSTMNRLWHYYVLFGVAGVGFAALGFIPTTALIFNWFREKRGTAIGIIGIGVGAGGFVISTITGSFLLPGFGWRFSWIILGLFAILAVVPFTLLVVKTRPEDIGLQPDGADAPPAEGAAANAASKEGLSLEQALKTRAFWLLSISCMLSGFPLMAIIQNQVVHLTDVGITLAIASSAVGAMTLGSIGRFGFGFVCNWIKPKYVLGIGLLMQTVALLILMTVQASTPVVIIWFYALLLGLGLGSLLPTMSILTSTNFGVTAYGTIYGMISMINQIGAAAGPVAAGAIYDNTGSYQLAFIIFLILFILATVCALLIRQPKSMEGIHPSPGHR